MALVKFGGGVVQMSGSLAGTTHARNRFGNYTRPRTKPVNPKSDRQEVARTRVRLLADYWHSEEMSDAERGAWNTYAAAIAMKNRMGETISITGFNHFIRSNSSRFAAGAAIVEAGPTELSLPEADVTLAAVQANGNQQISVAFDASKDWAKEVGGYLLIEMGQPQLHTRNFFGGPWRIAGAIAGKVSPPLTSPQLLSVPFTLTTGQKVWVRASIIRADARTSNKFRAPAFIVGGLLSMYNVTGTTLPNFNCNYALGGAFNGKAFFARTTGGAFIWWDGVDTWYVSTTLGTPDAACWSRTDPEVAGPYVAVGEPTGTCDVAAGEHP